MDNINFANVHTPYEELQLARWYTISCILIAVMLIGMCSIYVMQWRTYQHAMHAQQSCLAHQALMQEHAHLEMQHKERSQLHSNQTITKQKLKALHESLGTDMSLTECVLTPTGTHTLTLSAPSRHRAQECVAALNKKQLFGTLAITSLTLAKQGNKNYLLVVIKNA